jgi:hypothetical protein
LLLTETTGMSGGYAPTFLVRIPKDFDPWEVTDLQ